MAIKDMDDYLSSATADYTATEITLVAHNVIVESPQWDQEVIRYSGGRREVLTFNANLYFKVQAQYNNLSQSDAGILFDFFNDSAKGYGTARSFYVTLKPSDTIYTAYFDKDVSRSINPVSRGSFQVSYEVIGTKP